MHQGVEHSLVCVGSAVRGLHAPADTRVPTHSNDVRLRQYLLRTVDRHVVRQQQHWQQHCRRSVLTWQVSVPRVAVL